jgi:hypothetical protein
MLSPDFHYSIPLLLYSTRTAVCLSTFTHYSSVLFRMTLAIDSTASHECSALSMDLQIFITTATPVIAGWFADRTWTNTKHQIPNSQNCCTLYSVYSYLNTCTVHLLLFCIMTKQLCTGWSLYKIQQYIHISQMWPRTVRVRYSCTIGMILIEGTRRGEKLVLPPQIPQRLTWT